MTIGMGILRTPGEVAAHLPDARLFMLAWLLGGLYVLLGAVAVLQWRGVRWGGGAQELTSLVKALAFAALIAACFLYSGARPAAPDAPPSVPTGLALAGALVLALQSVIFTYDGWACVAYFGGEVRDSARDIPRSLLGSVATIIAIYLLVNLALLRVVPIQQLAGDKLAVGTAAAVVFGAHGGTVVAALALVSLLAALNANTTAAPRILFSMSRDGLFWPRGAQVNEGGTPTVALFISTV